MRYLLKQRIFSFSDSFTIEDEYGNDIYMVQGRVFSIGDKLSFQNMDGDELLFIKQRIMSFTPTYEIYRGNDVIAVISKEMFSFFKCRFDINVLNGTSLEVEGDFLHHDYNFIRNGRVIADISKEWMSFSDRYGIDIESGEDDVFILACAVIIDMVCHDDKH